MKKSKVYMLVSGTLCICMLVSLIINKNIFAENTAALKDNPLMSSIDVKLKDQCKNIEVEPNETAKISYDVTLNEVKTSVEAAVYLVDVSSKMKNPNDGGTRDRIKFAEDIVRNTKDVVNNSNNRIKLKAGVIGYSDRLYTFWSNTLNDKENTDLSKIKLYDMNTDEGYRLNDRGATIANTIMGSNSGSRNITPALEKADEILKGEVNGNIKNRNKAIIIITSGSNSIDWSDENIIKIVNKGYKIITIDISNQRTNEIDTSDERDLKDMTKKLSKSNNYTFLELKSDGQSELSDEQKNKLSMSDSIFMKVNPVKMNNENEYNYSQNKIYIPAMKGAIYGSISAGSNQYEAGEAKFTFDLGDNFKCGNKATIKYDGRTVDIDISLITDNKVEIDISNFIRYTKGENGFVPDVSEFTISFDVTPIGTGGTFGKDENGEDLSNLTYKERIIGQEVTNKILLETPTINVKCNAPDINASLINVNGVAYSKTNTEFKVKRGESAKITYCVEPNEFDKKWLDNYEIPNDVVIVLDNSKNMPSKYYNNQIGNGIFNKIMSAINNENHNMRYSLITYNSSNIRVYDKNLNTISDDKYALIGTRWNDINEFGNNMEISLENIKSTSEYGNTNNALEKAYEILEDNQRGANKNIILITSGIENGYVYDENVINDIKNNGVNFITLKLKNNNCNDKVQELHKEFGGKDESYIDATNSKEANDIHNTYMEKVKERILIGKNLNFVYDSIQMKFDLNDNFEMVSLDATVNGEKRKVDINGNILTINLKDAFEYKSNGELYQAKKFNVDFTIRLKEGKSGKLRFGTDNNFLIYDTIMGNERIKKVDTPIIVVGNESADHGIFENINEKGKAEYIKNVTFPNGSIVTCASNINELSSSNTNITLTIDKDATMISKPKIYKYKSSTKEIAEVTLYKYEELDNKKKFEITDFDGLNYNDIILIYSVQLDGGKDTEKYINNISVNNGEQVPVTINSGDNLPELF